MDTLLDDPDELTASSTANLFGILYAEDFDNPVEPDNDPAPGIAEPPAPPPITQADIDAACAAAVHAARLEWQATQEQSRLDAISSLHTALSELRAAVESSTLAVAEATVSVILAMISGLLPHFARDHGPAEVRALLKRLLPTIRSNDRIKVRVHPDLVELIQHDLDGLDGDLSTMVDIVAAPIEPGDVKVAWQNGSLSRDTKQIAQAIQDAMSQLGLRPTIEAPAKRSMAYAD